MDLENVSELSILTTFCGRLFVSGFIPHKKIIILSLTQRSEEIYLQ